MNNDKARDFFSAYYEGTLEAGLKQSFEARLSTDALIQADYAAFVETVQELNTLKDEEIEIPIFLSDRIATRLEQVQPKSRFGFPAWLGVLRGLAFAGLATAAIVFALPLVQGNHDVSNAGAISTSASVNQVRFKFDGTKVVLNYSASGTKTIVVSSPVTGKEMKRIQLENNRLESPLENSLAKAVVFKVESLGDEGGRLIAIPGSVPEKAKPGEGTVQDLAVALAGHYRVPVVIDSGVASKQISWNFGSADARAAASQAVGSEGFSVDQKQDGLVEILAR